MRLFSIGAETGMGQWGQLALDIVAVWTVLPNVSPNREAVTFLYFRFFCIGEKAKG